MYGILYATELPNLTWNYNQHPAQRIMSMEKSWENVSEKKS